MMLLINFYCDCTTFSIGTVFRGYVKAQILKMLHIQKSVTVFMKLSMIALTEMVGHLCTVRELVFGVHVSHKHR